MRGDEENQLGFIIMTSLEDRVPEDHPLRSIRKMVDKALKDISFDIDALYSQTGRPSIAPEVLLRAQLIQILYAIPSERRLVEQLEYNLLLRWFVGIPFDVEIFHATTFTKNRDRLLGSEIAETFFYAIRSQADAGKMLSTEHFSIDGTLIEAAASLKSFRPLEEKENTDSGKDSGNNDGGAVSPHKSRNQKVDFHGEKRANKTHQSTTDPESRLAKKSKGKEAKLSYHGHALSENRNGLITQCCLTEAVGNAESDAGILLLSRERKHHAKSTRLTLGADKGYDTSGFVKAVRRMSTTPHVAHRKKGSAIDARTTSWPSYHLSLRRRKLIEECFGWMKTVGGLRKLKHRGKKKASAIFTFHCAAYNLVRMRKILEQCALN